MNDSVQSPGAGLCGWAGELYSMAPTLAAQTVGCAKVTPAVSPAAQRGEEGGSGASGLLIAFDRGVLVRL